MTKPRTKRRGGPSGKNLLTDVRLRAEDDEIETWEAAAARAGVNRNAFLREAANRLAEAVLGDSAEPAP